MAVVSTVLGARNNAEWCDAFCRAHGVAGRFDDDAWSSSLRTPPLYPDAVTLVRGADAGAILARVDAGAGCSVKDSFGDLDLAGHGFEVLFRAEWLCLERAQAPTPAWSVVESAAVLAKWETAWGEPPVPRPFFCPALLADEAVAVLARYDGDRIAAGAVANRGGGVIGLSNVFDRSDGLASAFRGAAGAAQARWGPVPVVGYESGAQHEAARRAGFVSIGELAVWIRPWRTGEDSRGNRPGRMDTTRAVGSRAETRAAVSIAPSRRNEGGGPYDESPARCTQTADRQPCRGSRRRSDAVGHISTGTARRRV